MNRWIAFAAFASLSLAAVAMHPSAAEAQAFPPSTYIASYEPIYYNGFAHYLYRDHWFYRDRGVWHGYDHEPAFLHDHRGEWAHHWHRWR